jgi:hypothetical protein
MDSHGEQRLEFQDEALCIRKFATHQRQHDMRAERLDRISALADTGINPSHSLDIRLNASNLAQLQIQRQPPVVRLVYDLQVARLPGCGNHLGCAAK